MGETFTIELDSNHLLSIFAGTNLEQPYRFQSYLQLIVSFEEYIKFVRQMEQLSVSWLYFSLEDYKKALNLPKLLLKMFYFDVSESILSEIVLANAVGQDATCIMHDFKEADAEVIQLTHIMEKLVTISDELTLKAYESFELDDRGYFDVSTLSQYNETLFLYALYLRTMCYKEQPIKFRITNHGG